ncbi:hypothetical protein Pint_22567 [Pistacia integerrima]|uniref:Uncharacterized protein n=1 Tax=Pistacia integerrima TaxID=434235 RepID=A0ACC0YJY5_9ROSI|nr:hypothetical protein Pint_22567 [Pistacia integerrima]
MVSQVDKHQRSVELKVDQQVYLKLQPYSQLLVSGQAYFNLGQKYCGPFAILKRVGKVAYKLALPERSKIHSIFHVSLLKSCSAIPIVTPLQLPPLVYQGLPHITPLVVLGRRIVSRKGVDVSQLLVQCMAYY